MDKEQLIQQILALSFENDFKALLIEMVEKAPQVDQELYTKLADVMELQAEFYENCADLAEEEEEMYDEVDQAMQFIDDQEAAEDAVVRMESQYELLKKLQEKLQNIPSEQHEQVTADIERIQQELASQINGEPQNAVDQIVSSQPAIPSQTKVIN
jgi:phage shock protein A